MPQPKEIFQVQKLRDTSLEALNEFIEDLNKALFELSRKADQDTKAVHISREPLDWDFTITDLTMDDAWHELNLSEIVPKEAFQIDIHMTIRDATPGLTFRVRKKSGTNYSAITVYTQAANLYETSEGMLDISEEGIVEYYGSVGLSDFLFLAITGYWIYDEN